jgi:hypothetical protein
MVSENHMVTLQKRYFLLHRRDLAYLKFILEAYEGLTTLSTIERMGEEAVVRLATPTPLAPELDRLIGALRAELAITETTAPLNESPERKDGQHA